MSTDEGEQAIRDRVAGLAPGELSRLAERLGLLRAATPPDPGGAGGAGARAEPATPPEPGLPEGPDVGPSLDDMPDSDVDSMIERLLDAGDSRGAPDSPVGDRVPDDDAGRTGPGPQADDGLAEVGPTDLDAILAVLLGEPAADHAAGNGVSGSSVSGHAGPRAPHRGNGAASNGHPGGVGALQPRRSPHEPGDEFVAAIRRAVDDLGWARAGPTFGNSGSGDRDAWARFVATVTTAWRRLPDHRLSPAAAVEVGTLLVMGGTRGGAAPGELSGPEGTDRR